ncbi:MAG: O-antigen ligase family protein [Methylacidiphilales bacterium]|nr:O-antigen ligase family protein [Candidatus Methylacidiphilales bacterium]NJR14324.1 O-antigen ligase family protein [Calothrix sp. CSU_2_0]
MNKIRQMLLYYPVCLAILAVFTFFSNLDIYIFDSGLGPPPSTLIIGFDIACIPLLFSIFKKFKYISKELIIWCIFYAITALLYLNFFTKISEITIQELETRTLSVIFIMTMHFIFSQSKIVQNFTRAAIIIVSIISVLNIFAELADPLIFAGLNETGRPAGWYINPNIAGGALNLGIIFGVTLLPRVYRIPFIIFIGIGVFLTFSRGAISCWALIVMLLMINRLITGNQLLRWLVGIGIINFFISSVIADALGNVSLLNDNIRGRLVWLQDPSARDAEGDTGRIDIVEIGWRLFLKNPIIGNGLASTQTWSQPIATHNMYLNLMIDHGILGIVIMPLLIYSVIYKAREEAHRLGFIFAVFTLLYCIFSHNLLEERYMLVSYSLMAAMTMQSRIHDTGKTI